MLLFLTFSNVLVQQWHPDKWTRRPSLLGEAKHKFQQIQEAYSGTHAVSWLSFIIRYSHAVDFFPICWTFLFLVASAVQLYPGMELVLVVHFFFLGSNDFCAEIAVLSDQRKRAMYDAGLYHTLEDEDEVCWNYSIGCWLLSVLLFFVNQIVSDLFCIRIWCWDSAYYCTFFRTSLIFWWKWCLSWIKPKERYKFYEPWSYVCFHFLARFHFNFLLQPLFSLLLCFQVHS